MAPRQTAPSALLGALVLGQIALPVAAQPTPDYEFHDSHFHLTNYIQEGADIHEFLGLMGDTVGRVALFGIPLQQTWSYENSGDFAPTYYLQTDAPLYYYSFTDAYIASVYKSLTPQEQARFEPMITGFNPADMYAADHIRRVLKTFPGVFTGIGEFTFTKSSCRRKSPATPRASPIPRSTGSSIFAPKPVCSCCCTTTSTCRSRARAPSPST